MKISDKVMDKLQPHQVLFSIDTERGETRAYIWHDSAGRPTSNLWLVEEALRMKVDDYHDIRPKRCVLRLSPKKVT